MTRFLCAEKLVVGRDYRLSADESHHLVKVLRIEVGERILLLDGEGVVAEAIVKDPTSRGALVQVVSFRDTSVKRSRVHLCFGLPKQTALDFIVHRATEIGVASFQPLLTQHSLHTQQWNHERWQKVVQEVCKQCEDPFFPTLHAPARLNDWLGSRQLEYGLLLCDEADRQASPLHFAGDVYLLVGAEGGWADAERHLLVQAGAASMGLGKNRLRAETAALASAVLAKRMLGEL